jgi:hypothetical protein
LWLYLKSGAKIQKVFRNTQNEKRKRFVSLRLKKWKIKNKE